MFKVIFQSDCVLLSMILMMMNTSLCIKWGELIMVVAAMVVLLLGIMTLRCKVDVLSVGIHFLGSLVTFSLGKHSYCLDLIT